MWAALFNFVAFLFFGVSVAATVSAVTQDEFAIEEPPGRSHERELAVMLCARSPAGKQKRMGFQVTLADGPPTKKEK